MWKSIGGLILIRRTGVSSLRKSNVLYKGWMEGLYTESGRSIIIT